jgi:hypothetical protein
MYLDYTLNEEALTLRSKYGAACRKVCRLSWERAQLLEMSKLLLDQAVLPPRLQAFAGLDNVLLQLFSLGSNELLSIHCTIVNLAALSAVLPDLRDL